MSVPKYSAQKSVSQKQKLKQVNRRLKRMTLMTYSRCVMPYSLPPSFLTVLLDMEDMATYCSIICAKSSYCTSLSNLKCYELKCLTPLILATQLRFSFASIKLSFEQLNLGDSGKLHKVYKSMQHKKRICATSR